MSLLESTAFGTAVVFGFRHGFDWDHLAALTDLTGSQVKSRRAMLLASLYVLGHALMILCLGVLAIMFSARLPTSIDTIVERFVGASLLALGVWIIWTTLRTHGAPPLQSRWMLVISALRHAARRWRRRRAAVVIDHAHGHRHGHGHGDLMHDHAHVLDPRARASSEREKGRRTAALAVAHHHRHRHVAMVPKDPFVTYDTWSSFGIGMLHGVGRRPPLKCSCSRRPPTPQTRCRAS